MTTNINLFAFPDIRHTIGMDVTGCVQFTYITDIVQSVCSIVFVL